MASIAVKKQQKRDALMCSAYDLFTTEGFSKTTIRDISHKAGVAKGTFYLYFNDKEDIREELIRSHASDLLVDAVDNMNSHRADSAEKMDITDEFIYIIDYLVERVAADLSLLKLIGKHLSLGMFINTEKKENQTEGSDDVENGNKLLHFKEFVTNLVDESDTKLRDPILLFYTLISMVNSACYDILMYQKPVSLEEYKPYLNRCIRALVSDAIIA